jgi:LuxR family maltose regulon positive regulatory protein
MVAWLSLEEVDDDPIRFWDLVIAALRRCRPTLGETALALLHSPQSLPLSTCLSALLQELERNAQDIILLLDDYHVISDQAICDSMRFLLDHAPATLHLVLISRTDPDLPLSRWRVRGQLLEIRDRDLRFTEAEAASFLRDAMGVPLSEDDVATLSHRTEGWIAGLHLAALSLRRRQDYSAFVKDFAGTHRYLLDYVQQDILAREPLPLQDFLLQTSILTRMNAALCHAVIAGLGEPESQEMLQALERANLFVVPLDEHGLWYRYHDLFREALLARLYASQPQLVPLLHLRAARFYEAQGEWREAITHALAASDFPYAADLLERFLVPQSWRNEYHTLRRFLARLPDEVMRARPALSLVYVHALIFTSQRGPNTLELVKEPLSMAEQGFRTEGNQTGLGAVLTVRAALTANQGDFARAFGLARQALSLLPEDYRQWRARCLAIVGTEAASAGQLERAQQLLVQGRALHERAGSLPGTLIATAMLGDVFFSQGALRQAARLFRQALATPNEQPDLSQSQLTLETGARDRYYERPALYGLAALSYEWNQLAEAEGFLQEAFSGGYHAWFHLLTPGLVLAVRLLVARGSIQRAHDFLQELAAQAPRPEVQQEIRSCQAWLALSRGDLAPAHQWAASSQEEVPPFPLSRREERVLLLARLRIAEGQPTVALDLLARWRQEAHLEIRRHSALQILLLETVAYEATGARAQAKEALLQACQQARLQGYQRLFLDEGASIETVLKALLREELDEALAVYVRTLLRAFAAHRTNASPSSASASKMAEPLTAQERRVLHLLAEGCSNQEIADHLIVSLATAKKHVANVLLKMGAQNRTQAVALARTYSLL